MTAPCVVVLATVETKAREVDHLTSNLRDLGVGSRIVDLSLRADAVLSGRDKLTSMAAVTDRARDDTIAALASGGTRAVVAIGGGTGGEIALGVMHGLPIDLPKMLITPLPFDLRPALADQSVIVVPTLCDVAGLNATLRRVLSAAAAMLSALVARKDDDAATDDRRSVAVTALGATDLAVERLVARLGHIGHEATVFHANGYGGAAFARFAAMGAFYGLVDLTCHELTRLHLGGEHVDMPDRFVVCGDLPRVVLPGGLNFIGFGALDTVPKTHRTRPHYAHSTLSTHVQLSETEMADMATRLAQHLSTVTGPATMIVPMGGFSHQDAPGGAIEAPGLRHVFLETVQRCLPSTIDLRPIAHHIGAPEVTDLILDALVRHLPEPESRHA